MQLTEHTFKSFDGAELFYRAWTSPAPTGRSLVLFHRGHEHSARWMQTVEALRLEGFNVYAWDQRGHGKSPGERGSADNLATVIKDADLFARHLVQTHGLDLTNTVVLAHSVGAVIATAWVHDYAPPIKALVLGAPAFRVKLYVPFAIPALRIKQRILGSGYVKSYVKAQMLTHDPQQRQAYKDDPLIFRQIAVNILLDLHDTSTRLMKDAGAIAVPTLILACGKDWVVKLSAQKQFFEKIRSPIKQLEVYPDFYHALFHERDRQQVTDRIGKFINDVFANDWKSPASSNADQGGFTRTEYDLLRTPGCVTWKLSRLFLKTVGRLSEGISLGWQSGFDSGLTLDYVYRNEPRGRTFLGRMIDKNYLNSIGWRGIRIRRENLQRVLKQAMSDLHSAGQAVRIMDIAAGAGRYVLATMKSSPDIPASAVLRDYRQANLDAARLLADELGIKDVTCTLADAFDRSSLASTNPRPTIAIVSGLFELFPHNAGLRESLAGMHDALETGGYLIYTNQPWHPQVQFIARVLTNREGQPWIMRRRTQAEMDELVREAGFTKISQEIDPFGIFTVSVAKKG